MDAEKNKPMESTASLDAPSKKVGGVPKWKQRARKMMWPLHARFPNHIANPYGDEKAYFLDRDAKENVETSLDDGVSLQLACIMVSEMFGPNEIDALYKGLAKIGWDREQVPIREGSNVDWLKDLRLYGKSGTLPLGWVHRNKDLKKYLGVRYTAEFPQDFSSLLVSISHVTPSTTCLTVGFVLNAEAALEYARAINEPANTTRVPQRRFRSYSIMSVEHVKEERIRHIRERYRKTAILWMKKSFPGYAPDS